MNIYDFLQQKGREITRDKGEHLFVQGDESGCLYYVQSGLLKAYYTVNNGKESVKSFIFPSDIIGSLGSAYSGQPVAFGLVCLEPSVLYEMPLSILTEYGEKNIEMANHLIRLLLRVAAKKEQREYEFLCLSAEERFRILIQRFPTLLDQVTQNDVASYLGITPVGLSRIKKRVLAKCQMHLKEHTDGKANSCAD